MKRITKEQIDYIVAHINDRPRKNVQKKAGVSSFTIYKVIRKYGGEIDYTSNKPNITARDITIAEYPYMSGQEIADKYGITRSSVTRWAKRLNIRHTPETTFRLKEKCRNAIEKSHNDEWRKNRAASWKRTRRTDELRVLSGIAQKTKLRFATIPRKTSRAIWWLKNKYNYFTDSKIGGLYVVYYDDETHRTPREQHYVKKYGLKFCKA